MARVVAGRSLATLIELADSPPINPPLQLQGEEPLVLYIARVPGSQDIFLTTMKPKDKVVSAHDVESSLYYCHLSDDRDEELLEDGMAGSMTENGVPNESFRRLDIEPGSVQENLSSGDLLAISTNLHVPGSSTKLTDQIIDNDMTRPRIHRKPVAAQVSANNPKVPVKTQRKVLGPRPLTIQPNVPRLSQSQGSSVTTIPAKGTENLPPRDSSHGSMLHTNPYTAKDRDMKGTKTVTLIRRDPANGDQWNVGNISVQSQQMPVSPTRNPRKHKKDVTLELSITGYMKFDKQSPSSDSLAFLRQLNFSDHHSDLATAKQPQARSALQSSVNFLSPWRTPCSFETTASGRILKCYHSLPATLLSPSARSSLSGQPINMLVSELRFNLPSIIERSPVKKKENRRPMSYTSHASNHSGLKDSSVTGLQHPLNGQPSNTDATLRNAPKLPLRPQSYQYPAASPILAPNLHDRSGLHRRARSQGVPLQFTDYESFDIDEFGGTEMDLSLGQERAGGGFGGNKAKLGKLIIYGGQGLAMLDLLVAANMGVWFNDMLGG